MLLYMFFSVSSSPSKRFASAKRPERVCGAVDVGFEARGRSANLVSQSAFDAARRVSVAVVRFCRSCRRVESAFRDIVIVVLVGF